jgi:DNA replication protein DnaC
MASVEAKQAEAPPDRTEVEVERQQRAERLERSAILTCMLPTDRDRLIRDHLGDTPALLHTRAWLATPPATRSPILVLSGPTGRGKTMSAGWVIGVEGGLYYPVEELVRALSDRRTHRAETLVSARLIVLDDIGREEDSDVDRVRAGLVEIVDRRRSGRFLTLITTNLNGKAFASRYADARLLSRLAQSSRWEADGGPDMRRGSP